MLETLTLLLVLITGFYAWVTHRILKANELAVAAVKEQNEAISRPYVEAKLGLVEGFPIYVLTIRNLGKTTARNMKFSLDGDFVTSLGADKKLSEYPAFNQVIESFAPNAELNFWLGTGSDVHTNRGEISDTIEGFRITVNYEYADKHISETTTIDFRPYLYTDYPRNDIAQRLKALTEEVKKIGKKL